MQKSLKCEGSSTEFHTLKNSLDVKRVASALWNGHKKVKIVGNICFVGYFLANVWMVYMHLDIIDEEGPDLPQSSYPCVSSWPMIAPIPP